MLELQSAESIEPGSHSSSVSESTSPLPQSRLTLWQPTPYHGTLPRDDREVRLVVRLAGYADKVVVARASQPIAERVTLVRKAPAPTPPPEAPKVSRDRSVNPF
jgi:hypothetical protein